MPAKSTTVAPLLATFNSTPLPPLTDPRAAPASNAPLIPVDLQVPATHELATPGVAAAVEEEFGDGPADAPPEAPAEPDAPGVVAPFDVHAASPRVSPAATMAILVTRIDDPPYTNTSRYTRLVRSVKRKFRGGIIRQETSGTRRRNGSAAPCCDMGYTSSPPMPRSWPTSSH
jgi:hypothetical protein